ncbi:MAG: phospholipase D family protein [Alphaproteobacteria bacterium]
MAHKNGGNFLRKLSVGLAALGLLSVHTVFAEDTLVQRALHVLQGGGAQVMPPPVSVELAFSPNGGATELVIKAIGAAKQSIHVAAYAFTSRPIAKALVDARKAGIDVEIVVDHEQIEKDNHSEAAYLASQNIPVRVDIVHALQHDKYMVIDSKSVETGSFNYTAAAEQHNSENVIVLWDDPKLADAYAKNWKSLWDAAEAYSGR